MYTPAELQTPEPDSKVAQKIYATHASGKDVADLPALLSRLEAVLVDIRFSPPAQPLKWTKNYLKLLLKNKYLHIPTLGNRAPEVRGDLGGKHSIHNLALGLKVITELRINILLFCACENEKNCHRRFIAGELIRQGKEVADITDWKGEVIKN